MQVLGAVNAAQGGSGALDASRMMGFLQGGGGRDEDASTAALAASVLAGAEAAAPILMRVDSGPRRIKKKVEE
jgi:hypothetical protein